MVICTCGLTVADQFQKNLFAGQVSSMVLLFWTCCRFDWMVMLPGTLVRHSSRPTRGSIPLVAPADAAQATAATATSPATAWLLTH